MNEIIHALYGSAFPRAERMTGAESSYPVLKASAHIHGSGGRTGSVAAITGTYLKKAMSATNAGGGVCPSAAGVTCMDISLS